MADPFVAEVRMFGLNFAPRGWALCNGQIMAIAQNTALFSLLGTTYGGDGRSTFGLPNLQGAAAMGAGHGPGLTPRPLGAVGGSATVTLLTTEIPAHGHGVSFSRAESYEGHPGAGQPAMTQGGLALYAPPGASSPTTAMSPLALGVSGSSQPHNNLMPYLAITFCIALQGVFPPRP
ncbi:phage tail protein [Sandaracinus amylolyticus]|uniref:Microcystin dependent protein n=1 Tax=Sandaracinus amylolyticus TaxID=927083 RepID=A0A0F6W568_9BACT|nr:tail fiber protein [Sandaracinus amylolyticus]AKF07711.1 Microcystin dependent protein [Sandaracinus amylolyticus]